MAPGQNIRLTTTVNFQINPVPRRFGPRQQWAGWKFPGRSATTEQTPADYRATRPSETADDGRVT
jgi:hypothetical protein